MKKLVLPRVSFQAFGVLIFALVLLVGWDFSQRVMLTMRLQQSEQSYDQQIAHAEATRTALQNQKKQVQTDAFIEDKVRREKHYLRDGETLVIPQITPASAPANSSMATSAAPTTTWWQDLLDFLFGP